MPERKEEVVISGIGGLFPECENLDELKELLFNKVNGVTIDSRRWKLNTTSANSGTGKLKNIDKFDATFFSVHSKLAQNMDMLTRKVLETSIAAIIDAGLSPIDLSGTNTSVFMGSSLSEIEMDVWETDKTNSFSMLGLSRTMQANRLSYFLNLTGPSYTTDGAWICGSNCLEKAKRMIEEGIIPAAIVGVTNLVLRPEIQFQFQGVNRLNQSDCTKSFDSNADGYNRSEACVVMFLQKASDAKRSYGTLLNVQSIQFGDHQEHILDHVGTHFKSLLLNSYKEANIDPATVEFIEANGSGIKNVDSLELNIMEEVFCTKQRKAPLKVGSIKSNLGNCESCGLFVSIVKAIIAFESGYLPPNINYAEPNENVEALKNGKIEVVTEKTPFHGDIIGISSFGILNAFSHVILKRNDKIKKLNQETSHEYHIPRLIVASGRTEENTRKTIEKIKRYGNDDEYLTLANNVFTKTISAHFYRSFSFFPNLDESRLDDVWKTDIKTRPVWFIFSGMGSQWQGMGSNLMNLPIFADAINKCDSILKPRGVDIKNILTSLDPKLFDNILNSFVGIAAVQIGLVEVLKALEITPDGIIGHSVGELGCAYADGCFTLEEMILSAYARGRASIETNLIPGMMAAIGLGYHQIKDVLPGDIDIACHNSATSCTISGPAESINKFVKDLKSKGIFAKAVNVAGIAYHSRYIQSAGPTLLKYLKEIIKEPKARSSKWISTSLPETKWNSDLAKYSSPEYHTNNLLNSVLFEEALKNIPSDAITIEIAPHGLLQAIIKGELPDTVTNIPLTKKVFGGDSVRFLLTAIGKMYTNGLNPKIEEIYPEISFPVGRGTPSLNFSSFWNHDEEIKEFSSSGLHNTSSEIKTKIVLNDEIYLIQYQIHGHHILPFAYVLTKVWRRFIEINDKDFMEEPVQFTNLQFKNNIKIHPINESECLLMIQLGSGRFEFSINNEVIFTGQIEFISTNDLSVNSNKPVGETSNNFHGSISKDEIYAVFKQNGFNLGDNFKNITNVYFFKNNIQGSVMWNNDWIYFLNGLLKFPLMESLNIQFNEAVTSIRQLRIIPKIFAKYVNRSTQNNIHVDYNLITKEITCAGLTISDVETCPIKLSSVNNFATMKIETQTFFQFYHQEYKTVNEFIQDSFGILIEADQLNLISNTRKIIFNIPYCEDPISKECEKAIVLTSENHLLDYNVTINWENNNQNNTEFDETVIFVTLTNINYLQDTMKTLANKKLSYIIVSSKQSIKDLKNWKVITQQKLNDNNYLVLMKKKIPIDENCIFIKPIGDKNDQSVWKTLENNKYSNSIIFLMLNKEPLEGVTTYVKDMLRKYKSQKMRFLFIFDSNAPDFKTSKSFYIDQLSLGLTVNVYKNGGWGFYKKRTLQNISKNSSIIKNPIPKIFLNNSKLEITFLGLNFKRLIIEDDKENEMGPLEYSGFLDNIKIMGITSFKPTTSQINYEPLLSWPVPPTWSMKDAATVPLSYALCYYVFKICTPEQKFPKSVLVTSGLHPIGLAAISISLFDNFEVYTLVESNQQADHLSYIFPELPRSRIIINTNNQFDISIKMMTEGKGIDIILNFLSGEAFDTAFHILADHGTFFNFSKSDIEKKRYMGLRQFLKDTSFTVISSDSLLNESDCNKRIIQQAFNHGLNKQVIKPFQCFDFKSQVYGSELFDTMRTAFKSNIPEKVVLSLNDYIKCSNYQKKNERCIYQCNPDHVFIIIDQKSDWLDLAEWLVDRGAKKFVISVNTCLMSITNSKRFNRLISQNISMQIETDSFLQTKEDSLKWLNRITTLNVLGSIFVINQFDDKKISNLRYSFVETKNKTMMTAFICILSNGKHICNDLRSMGIKAINLSWDEELLPKRSATKLLPSLDFVLLKTDGISYTSILCSEKNDTKSQRYHEIENIISNIFPDSLDELYLLNEKMTKEACFIEVQTKSPRFSQLKSGTPLFVIPGFKPKLMKTLYKQFIYPAFEANLPENVSSIDKLSELLVNNLKNITNKGCVSLIGESWGGIVALKMAQILESQGIMVTVSLLEGDPEILTSWCERFLLNENIINKLTTVYKSFYKEHELKYRGEKYQSKNYCFREKIFDNTMQTVLASIRSKLKALVESKPLSNKLQTKVHVFRYERTFEFSVISINDYCVNAPFVHIVACPDHKQMMVNKKIIDIISENAVYSLPLGIELSLRDKYKHFFFLIDQDFKNL